jgi:beta-glucosidase
VPIAQLNLVKALAKTGKPIILVLVENRPRIINEIENLAQSILMSYLPGDEGGKAISDILFGDVNPSGKLPFTYPRYTGSFIPYDHKFSEKLDKNFTENGYNPQYPFGYGLSFSNFIYSDLSLSSQTISPVDTLIVKVKVKNTSNLSGKEVIQLYISDTYASITPSVKKLIAFDKQFIEEGKEITVVFKITKDDLTFVDKNNSSIYEEGDFEIYISNLTNKFILKK